MSYIKFDANKTLDVIPIGRIAIDFNPTDMNMPLSQSGNFNKYVGGSPANIAVGLARLGAKCGFIARVSDDQFGDYVENYFKADGIDVSHVFRCENGENLGLTFTEILSPTQSSILMYREALQTFRFALTTLTKNISRAQRLLLFRVPPSVQAPQEKPLSKHFSLQRKTALS